MPFRVIVTEKGSWQNALGMFLQKKLKLLEINDPFLVRNSREVTEFFKEYSNYTLSAFSIDIKDLYYSLPRDALYSCIEECVDLMGHVTFQNAAGVSVSSFLDLLATYLTSTYVEWNGDVYQNNGVSIGSSIAPILSDLLLAKFDRNLKERLSCQEVVRIFRFVDDYLVVFKCESARVMGLSSDVIEVFSDCLSPLVLTHELPVNNSIRFLDMRLLFSVNHACWMYEPRAMKPLLPFKSAHSKLVKRGIVNTCFTNALDRSCFHMMETSFQNQVERLKEAGYPDSLLISVAETIKKKKKPRSRESTNDRDKSKRDKVAVIPYKHQLSHKIKKLGQRMGVKVVFSAPYKLSQLAKMTCVNNRPKQACTVRHKTQFVRCDMNVVYRIPLSCGACYIGQTGRCLNERLREHARNVRTGNEGFLAQHISRCGCLAQFESTVVMFRHKDDHTRMIVEAEKMAREPEHCVSKPSLALLDKELRYLASGAHGP